MKLCLDINLNFSYLDKADEIKFSYPNKNKELIKKIVDNYPLKTYIWKMRYDEELTEDICDFLRTIIGNNLIIEIRYYDQALYCRENNLKFYFSKYVNSFYELNTLKELEVSYVYLGAPLFFDLDRVKKFKIPIRAVPNIAYMDGLVRQNGVCGTWIAPDNLHIYENYIGVIEFLNCEKSREEALMRIYWQNKTWPGQLTDIITNLDYKGYSLMLDDEFAKRRLNCRQSCQAPNIRCRGCYNALKLADPNFIASYRYYINKK